MSCPNCKKLETDLIALEQTLEDLVAFVEEKGLGTDLRARLTSSLKEAQDAATLLESSKVKPAFS